MEFLSSGRGALADLQKAQRAERTTKKRLAEDVARKGATEGGGGALPRRKRGKTGPGGTLFDFAPDLPGALALPCFTAEDDMALAFDPLQPCIIRKGFLLKTLSEEPAMAAALQEFKASFETYAKRTGALKAQKRIIDEQAAGHTERVLLSTLPDRVKAQLVVPSAVSVGADAGAIALARAALSPALYGHSADVELHGHDKDHVASLRVALEGTRQVVLTRALPLLAFMSKKENPSAAVLNPLDIARAPAFLKSLTVSQAREHAAAAALWTGTLGPGDLIYVPATMFVSERMGEQVLGARIGLLFNGTYDASGLKDMAELEKQIAAAGKPTGSMVVLSRTAAAAAAPAAAAKVTAPPPATPAETERPLGAPADVATDIAAAPAAGGGGGAGAEQGGAVDVD